MGSLLLRGGWRLLGVALLLVLAVDAWAGQLDATWTQPTVNTDGSPVTAPLTYRVYWQLFPQTPCPGTQFIVTNPNAASVTLINLTQGMTYNAQVTAVNPSGQESACSAVASAPAHSDPPLPVGTNFSLTFSNPQAPPFDFTLNGLVVGQVIAGMMRVNALPADGTTTGNHFRYDLLNSAGQGVVVGGAAVGNDEGASPYCFIGDPGALPCTAFDTRTVPNGAYQLRVVYNKSSQTPTVVKVIPFTVSN